MRRFVSIALGATSLLAPSLARAEDGKLDVSLELRARFEAIGGQFRPAPVPHDDAGLFLRTALAAEYDAGKVRVGGEIVDARAYFEKRRSSAGTTEINAIEPLQAYVATDFSDRFMAKAGRFVLNLGSRRLVARNNFRNSINGFTGIQAVVGDDRLGGTAFLTVTQTRLPDDIQGLRDNKVQLDRERGSPTFYGGFLHGKAGQATIEAYLYRLEEDDSRDIPTRNRHLWTVGGRIVRNPAAGAWDYELEAVGQGGHARATTGVNDRTDLPVHAGFAHGTLGRTFDTALKPRVAVLFDIASGETRGRSLTRFDTLFGARVFEFGPTGLFGAVQRANLISFQLMGEVKPDKRSDVLVAVRPLFLASDTDSFAATSVRDTAGNTGSHAGTQIEARVRRFLVPDKLRLSIGGAYLAKGRFLRDAPNAPDSGDSTYGFAELTATL